MMGNFPESYNLVVNSNHSLVGKILNEGDEDTKQKLAKQAADLALLSVGLLKGKDLTEFVNRSIEIIE
jgi:molecular chaperone HtpG